MDAKSQLKVIKAGFTIIRKDDTPSLRIKYKDSDHHEWTTFHKYETKDARERELHSLLELNLTIED